MMMCVRKCLLLAAVMVIVGIASETETKAANRGQPTNWNRFFYYPYVYYPHNFQRPQGSYDHLYYRYAPNMRIPVYNTSWHNFYPSPRPYHRGHHFLLDVL